MHRLARDDAGRLHLDAAALRTLDRTLAVDRLTERIDHPAEQLLADRHVDDRAGAADGVALADRLVVAEDDDADIVGLEIERHAADTGAREVDQLPGHYVLQTEHAGDAVAHGEHLAGLGDVLLGVERGDLLLEYLRDLGGADLHQAAPFMAYCRRCSRDLRLVS